MRTPTFATFVVATLLSLVGSAQAAPTSWQLAVPGLGLNARVQSNTEQTSLQYGPGFYTGIPIRPGDGATVAIAGHHRTHTHPFLHLDQLRYGARLYLTKGGKRFVFRLVRRIYLQGDQQVGRALGNLGAYKVITSTCDRGDNYRQVVSWLPEDDFVKAQARRSKQ